MTPTPRAHSRRHFLRGGLALAGLGLVTGCGVGSPPVGQPRQRARIGLFAPGSLSGTAEDRAFRNALRDLGWAQGENLVVEYRWAGTPEGLAAAAAELVALPVDLVVAAGNEIGRAAAEATRTVPVVMAVSSDPVGSGLVAGLGRPGGNLTGLATLGPELGAKRLELLQEALPGVSRVAVLWNPTFAQRAAEERSLQLGGGALGIDLQFLPYRGGDQYTLALQAARAWPADAVMLLDDPLSGTLKAAVEERVNVPMPMVGGYAAFARAGGLMAYGPDFPAMFARAAVYVDKILTGAKPGDLPVEQPTVFDFVVNLKTARALGLTIPQSVLLQATEVIQ